MSQTTVLHHCTSHCGVAVELSSKRWSRASATSCLGFFRDEINYCFFYRIMQKNINLRNIWYSINHLKLSIQGYIKNRFYDLYNILLPIKLCFINRKRWKYLATMVECHRLTNGAESQIRNSCFVKFCPAGHNEQVEATRSKTNWLLSGSTDKHPQTDL